MSAIVNKLQLTPARKRRKSSRSQQPFALIAILFACATLLAGSAPAATVKTRVTGAANWSASTTWIKTRTGTINVNAGSNVVNGSGTLFTTELAVGDVLMLASSPGTALGTVASIQTSTQLTLSAGSALTGSGAYGEQAVPAAGDAVEIGNANINTAAVAITLNTTPVSIGSLTFIAHGFSNTLTHSGTNVLNVTGSVTLNQPTSTATSNWAINAGTANVSGGVTFTGSTTTATNISRITITTGTLDIGGSLTYNVVAGGNAATAAVIMSGGAGNLNIAGSLVLSGGGLGTLTPGTTSTVRFDGSGAQSIADASGISYNNIIINKTAGAATLVNAVVLTGSLVISQGTLSAGANTLTVPKDWTNNGTFTAGTGTVSLNGTAQTLGGTAATTFNNLTVSGAGTKTINTNINVGGTLNVNGTTTVITPAAGVVINSAAAAGTLTGTGIVQVTRTAVTADFASQYKFTTNTLTSLTVDYAAAASQSVNALTYSKLTLSGSGTKSAAGAIAINSTLTIGSGITFDMGTNALSGTLGSVVSSGTLKTQNISATPLPASKTWTGSVEYNSATGAQTVVGGTYANLTSSNSSGVNTASGALIITGDFSSLNAGGYAAGAFAHNVGGDWNMPSGTFTSSGTITFNGIGTQTITASAPFYNLTVNKSSGGVSLLSDITVSGTLSFTLGVITAGNYTVVIPNGGAVTGAGQSSGWVNGKLQKYFATTTGAFEIGSASYYSPISAVLTNLTVPGSVIANATNAYHPNIGSSTINSVKNINRYWSVSVPATGYLIASSAAFTFNWNTADNYTPMTTSAMLAGWRDAYYGTWSYPTVSGTPTTTSITISGVASVGDFAVGESCIAGFSYAGSPYCNTGAASITLNSGATSGAFSATPAGLTLNAGTGAVTLSSSTPGTYTVTNSITTGCTVSATTGITVNGLAVSGSSTPTCVGGSTGTITVSASGSTSPYTYTLNGGTAQSSPAFSALAAATYTVGATSSAGCNGTASVVVSPYSVSTDNQTTAGTNSWVGHVYDGTGFTDYIGNYTQTETFNELFGGNTACFSVSANGGTSSIYTETFSVKYRMTSTKSGLYVVSLGSDDGTRLTVDGTMVYNNWADQSFTTKSNVLLSLNGASSLLYEFYENSGGNQVIFQSLTQVLANALTTNASQSICMSNAGVAIGGDTLGTLPTGITKSGTGYQWTYSTTPGGMRTSISGATGATFTPSTSVAPFNVAGTYYVFRNVALSSANNVSPNPYVVTHESNAATVIVNAAPSATISYAGNPYCAATGTATVIRTGTAGGTYTSTAGLSINASTGDVDLSASTAGSYTVTYTVNVAGCTTYTTTANIQVYKITGNSVDYTNGTHGVLCANVAEGATATLTAPAGTVFINVGFASYGTPTGSCPAFTAGSCHASTSQSVSESYLLGNNTASIPATNTVFTDPCQGTSKSYAVQAIYTQTLCAGTSAGTIIGTTPTGGNGSYTYLWESSATSASSGFAAATGTNNAKDYSPGALSQTTWFRRTVVSGGCSDVSKVLQITVVAAPSATISYSGSPYAANIATATVTLTGTSGGTFSSAAGLSIDATTGAITIGSSTPGTYTVTYTIGAVTGCNSFSTTTTVTIQAPTLFRSKITGTWNVAGTWETSIDGGATWSAAVVAPATTNDTVTISATHTVSVTANIAAKLLTVASTGILLPSSGITISGSGKLTGAGTVKVSTPTTGFAAQYGIATADLAALTVDYAASAAQAVDALTYYNLTLSGSGTKTASGNVVVNGALTVGSGITMSLSTYTLSGTLATIANSGTISTQSTSATPIPTGKTWGGTVLYNNATGGQSIVSGTYSNLTNSNTSGTNTAGGALTVNGALTLSASGTLNMGTYVLSGTLSSVAGTGTLKTQNTSAAPVPTGKTWTCSLEYNNTAGGQTVMAGTYANLTNSNTSGTNTASGAISVSGALALNASSVLNMGANALSGALTSITGTGTLRTQGTTATPVPTGKTWPGTTEYNRAAGAQTIVAGTYYNLTNTNTSGTNTAGGAITVNGSLTMNTSSVLNMGSYAMSGTLASVAGAGTLKTQNVTATPLPTGKTWSGTVEYNAATGAQTIVAGTYNNLTNTNTSGSTTAGGAITVNGALALNTSSLLDMAANALNGTLSSISGTGYLKTQNTSAAPIPSGKTWTGTVEYNSATGGQTLAGGTYTTLINSNASGTNTAGAALTITGNFTSTNGAFAGGAFTHLLGGNWNMPSGSFTSTGTTITLNGNGAQTITATDAFNNLTVNKTSGTTTLLTNTTVNGVLTFTLGSISTGSNTLIVPNGGSISGASQSTGWVSGNLQKYFATTSGSFEVGSSLYYAPLAVTLASLATSGSIIASTTAATQPNVANSILAVGSSINRYWSLTYPGTGAAAFTSATIVFNWNTADNYNPLTASRLRAAQYSAGAWSYPTVSGTPTSSSLTVTGITALGEFAIGEARTKHYVNDAAITGDSYTSAIGNDANAGTTAAPFLTISKAISVAATGDSIYVDAGSYNEQAVVNKGLYLKGAGSNLSIVTFTGNTGSNVKSVFTVAAQNVTIRDMGIVVPLNIVHSAIHSNGDASNIQILNNAITASATAASGWPSYSLRNAIAINTAVVTTGYTQYNGAGGVQNIKCSGNSISGTTAAQNGFADADFRAGFSADVVANITVGGVAGEKNTIRTVNHDVIIRSLKDGDITIRNNTFNGGGVELSGTNTAVGTITIDSNSWSYSSNTAPAFALLRLLTNNGGRTTLVKNNTFNNHNWYVTSANYNSVTFDGNTFTPVIKVPGSPNSNRFRHIDINTKLIQSGAVAKVTMGAVFINNVFNGYTGVDGKAISFLNHDSTGASFGTFTVGQTGAENTFSANITNYIYVDSSNGQVANSMSAYPEYVGMSASTTGYWKPDIPATENKFYVGSGSAIRPDAMTDAQLITLSGYVYDKKDNSNIGRVLDGSPFRYYVNDNAITGDVYTSAIGNDANSGTAAAPFLTIGKAMTVAQAGDTIYVDAGSYAEQVGASKKIVLMGANATISPVSGTRNAESVLNNSTGNGINVATTSRVIVKGFSFTTAGNAAIISNTNGNKITLEKNYFNGCKGPSIFNSDSLLFTDNKFNNLITGEGIFLQGNYNGTTGTHVQIYNNAWTNGSFTGINISSGQGEIYGNTFANISYYGILVANYCNLNITRNTFSGMINPDTTVNTYGAGVRFYTPSTGMTANVSNNYFQNGYVGVAVRSGAVLAGTNISVTNNYFSGNTSAHIINAGTGTLNASCNWFGAADTSVVAPLIKGTVAWTPLLANGIDNDITTAGFQPASGTCVTPKYWTGNTSTDWNTASNWIGNAVPTNADLVTIPTSPAGGRMPTLSSGTDSMYSLTVQSGATLTQSGGSLYATTAMTLNGAYAQSGGTFKTTDVAISASGTCTQTGGLLQVSRNYANNGVFSANGGTIQWSGTATAATFSGTNQLYHVLIDAAADPGIAAGNSISVAGNYTATTYTAPASSTITLNGPGTQNITGVNTTAPSFGNLVVNKASGTALLLTNANVTGDVTVTSGTLDLATYTCNRTVAGGSFTLGAAGTLRLSGASGGQAGSNTPYNFTGGGAAATSTVEYYGSNAVTQTVFEIVPYGNLILTNGSGSGSASKIINSNILVYGTVTVNGGVVFTPAATAQITGSGTLTGAGTVQVTRTAATADFLSQYTISNKTLSGLTVDYNASLTQKVNALNYKNLTVSGARATNNVVYDSTGTIGISGTFSPIATFTSGNHVVTSSTINFNGTGAQSIPAFNYHNLTVSGARTSNSVTYASSGTIGVAGAFSNTATFSGGSNIVTGSTIDFNGSNAQSISGFAFNNLTISGTGIKTATAALSVSSGLNIASGAILNMGTYSLSGAISSITGAGTIRTQNTSALPIPTGKNWTNTIDYTAAAGGQTVVSGTYANLINSNTSGSNTAAGAFTVSGTTTLNTSSVLNLSTAITTFKDLSLLNGSSLSVGTGMLKVSGTVTAAGSIAATSGTVEFNGTSAQVIPAGLFTSSSVKNLTTNNTAGTALGGTLNVTGVLKATTGTFATGSHLTLMSTATATALIDGSGAGSVTGDVTMQRYLPSGFGYRYISSPFQAALVSELDEDLNLAASFPALYRYDENLASAGWVKHIIATDTLKPFAGYAANFGALSAATTIDITGTVNNGALSTQLFNHNRTYSLGFNLVGNPYPSPIDWTAASGWTKTNIDNAIYYFNNGTVNQYQGAYSSYVNGVSSDGVASNIIPSMQGFFVHVSNGSYPVSATLAANNSVRVNNLSPSYHRETSNTEYPIIRLSAGFTSDSAYSDPMVVYFDNSATDAFEQEKDARKMLNTDERVPNLYSVSSEEKLAINAITVPDNSTRYIPLGLKLDKDGEVEFKMRDIIRMPAGLRAYFADVEKGIIQDAEQMPRYKLPLSKGEYAHRFYLMFSKQEKVLLPGTEELIAFVKDGSVYVTVPSGSGELLITNMLGQAVRQETIVSGGLHKTTLDGAAPGVYIVTLISDGRKLSKKVVVEQ